MHTSESVLVACIPTRWQYIMTCLCLGYPKMTVSHLCMHRFCLAVGMYAHIVPYSSSALKSSRWRHGQIILWYPARCMRVLPSSETQKMTEMSYWYGWRQISVNTSFNKKTKPTVTLGPMSHFALWEQQENLMWLDKKCGTFSSTPKRQIQPEDASRCRNRETLPTIKYRLSETAFTTYSSLNQQAYSAAYSYCWHTHIL